jgi:hypothetical protein
MIPEAMGHMAFPVPYFSGLIGWREPGIGYFHTIPTGGTSKLELALQVNKSDWSNPSDFGLPTSTDLNLDYGQLSGYPGVEARVKFTSDHLMAFAAGHWNHVMGTHAGDLFVAPAAVPTRNWDVAAGVAGVKLSGGGFTVMVDAYVGQNLAPLLGEMLNFIGSNDVSEWGGWAQLMYAITPHLNLSALGGTSQPSSTDMQAAALAAQGTSTTPTTLRAINYVYGGMIRYQDGGFAIGPEFHHSTTQTINGAGTKGQWDGNQFMLSGLYWF